MIQALTPKVANPVETERVAKQRTQTIQTTKKRKRRKTIAPIARSSTNSVYTAANQKTNVSGTKNTKAGAPEWYVMSWRSISNPAANSQPSWGGIRRRTANDGVGG